MKKALAVLAVLGAIALPASKAYAFCGASVPMLHFYGSYFTCDNSRGPVTAFSYLVSNPTATNSGLALIAKDSGPGQVQIATDWGNGDMVGCPQTTAGNQRVIIVVQANDGSGLLSSISGASFQLSVGYTVETAHLYNPDDPITQSFPLPCGSLNGRPTVRGVTTTDVTINVQPPHIFSDCDPGTIGEVLGDACVDGFSGASGSIGGIYTRVQPCGTKPDVRRSVWTATGVTPSASGDATIPYTKPAADTDCLYVGTTTSVGGLESSSINGFIQVQGGLASTPKAENVRAAFDKGKVTASWSTSNELGLAGFRLLTSTKSKGQFEIGSFDAKGSPSTYSVTLGMGDFKGGRTLIIRAVLTDGTTVDAAPVNF